MSYLNRKLARDILAHWAQVGTIMLVLALGIMMFSGPLLAQRDLRDSIQTVYRLTRYEDFSLGFASAPASAARRVRATAGVEAAEGRLVRDLLATVKGRSITLRIVSIPDEGLPTVNSLIPEAGSSGDPKEGEFLVEHHLAREFGLVPGDQITVFAPGGTTALRAAGSAVSPEYLRLVRNRSEYVSDPRLFGVAFARYSTAARLLEAEGTINEVAARVRDGSDPRAAMREAARALSGYNMTSAQEGADKPGAVALELETGDIAKLALFFSILLLAVAALALYITMTRIVLSQQREIGITRALGYGGGTLIGHYLGYGGVIGLAGGALGTAAGYALSRLFIDLYADVFGLPLVRATIDPAILLLGFAAALLFAVAGALVPARHAVRMRPAEAIRTGPGLSPVQAPRAAARRGWPLPPWLRFSLRNLSRNRRRVLLTCLGVAGTICVLVTATGGKDSIDHAVDKYVNGVLRWNVAAAWQGEPAPAGTLDAVRELDGVIDAEPAVEAPGVLAFEGETTDVQVQALQADTEMHGVYPAGGRQKPGPGELVLSKAMTRKIPVDTGDVVTLSTAAGSLPFTVAGFVNEPIGGVCYADLGYVQELVAGATGVPGAYNAVLASTQPKASERVAREMRKLSEVSQVVTRQSIERLSDELMGAIRSLLVLFYVLAFAMGFATLFSMTTVNLLERAREVATMRTLGAGRARIFSLVTLESLAVVGLALLPGIAMGALLEWVLVTRLLTSERLAPDAILRPATVLIVVAASLAVILLSELPATARLWRMDLARATKQPGD